ncbi:MAG TPA: type IV pilin protein [Burkholderiaceae bacterium]|nr:type IV pilin protein [Burkholderiaceae bacterium]
MPLRLPYLPERRHRSAANGFTLIEIMVALAVVAILASIALPSYAAYVKKSRARGAAADLATLAMNMENKLQLQLSYPVYESAVEATATLFPGWSASMSANFKYTVKSTSSSYELKASGLGTLSDCSLTLTSTGSRTASSACGFESW